MRLTAGIKNEATKEAVLKAARAQKGIHTDTESRTCTCPKHQCTFPACESVGVYVCVCVCVCPCLSFRAGIIPQCVCMFSATITARHGR